MQAIRVQQRRYDAANHDTALPTVASKQERVHGEIRHYPEKVFPKQLQKLKEKGLIEIDNKEVRLTKMGEVWKGNIAWEFAPNQFK